jgi:hypothetical protein
MQVRSTDQEGVAFEETTRSENVCRDGAAFSTQHDLGPGADVEITIPLPRQGSQPETDFSTRGRVVHIAPGRSRHERVVGIEFLGPRFHGVFQPELTG